MDFYMQNDNGGWPERDSLPEHSIYDDIVPEKKEEETTTNSFMRPLGVILPMEADYEMIQRNLSFDGGCPHKEWKKVYYTHNKAYKMCLRCKEDLGDC